MQGPPKKDHQISRLFVILGLLTLGLVLLVKLVLSAPGPAATLVEMATK